MPLDSTQLEELHGRGWTRVPAFLDPTTVGQVEDAMWAFLGRRGIDRHDPTTWPDRVPKLQPLRRGSTFDPWLTPQLEAITSQLLGADNWHTFGGRPAALITMPTAGPWRVPHKVWHLDLPARGHTDRLDAVRIFGLGTDVAAHGGATIVVEGSPTLVRRMVEAADGNAGSSSDARKALARRYPFFTTLGQPGGPDRDRALLAGETIDGVEVRVAEVTGAAGDLIVMDPWMVHNLNMNTSATPRFAMNDMRYALDSALFATA